MLLRAVGCCNWNINTRIPLLRNQRADSALHGANDAALFTHSIQTRCAALPKAQQSQTPEQQQQHEIDQEHGDERKQHQLPAFWFQGIEIGRFEHNLKPVDWKPSDLVKVLLYALPAAATALGINSSLPSLLESSHSSAVPVDWQPASPTPLEAVTAAAAAAAAGITPSVSSSEQAALLHVSQEAVLAVLLSLACRLALGPRVYSATASSYWVVQTLGTCMLLFPLVDPLLSSLWKPVAEVIFGPAPVNSLVVSLQQAGSAHQYGAVLQHCVASGLLGPFWEEVFWRGFFLTALTKVLPAPACVALSALNFAGLHLSPHNFLPLLVLGATCDCLYLRSGGNLLTSLLLHGLWNTSQVLQVALLHKDTFV